MVHEGGIYGHFERPEGTYNMTFFFPFSSPSSEKGELKQESQSFLLVSAGLESGA